MTILSVTKDVCATVGVVVPASVFSGITANRTMLEMLALANEMARRIAYDTRDWTRLKVRATLVGDGVATAFDLPDNYLRMPITSNVWNSGQTQTPMRFVSDTDEWVKRRTNDASDGRGEWTIYGGQMHISPVMPVGQTASFVYIDKNCVELSAGGFGDTFAADDDRFVLSERLLKLGMTWQWKAHKGSPYAEDMGTYSDALAMAMGYDKPSPIIVGRVPISVAATVAYPWPAPTPP